MLSELDGAAGQVALREAALALAYLVRDAAWRSAKRSPTLSKGAIVAKGG